MHFYKPWVGILILSSVAIRAQAVSTEIQHSKAAASGPGVSIVFDLPDCDSLCLGQVSAQVSGGTPPYNYSWSTGAVDSFATGLCARQPISVTVTDSAGHSTTATYTMPFPLRFSVSTTPASCPTCCDGSGTIQLISSCATPVTYLWQPGFVTIPSFNNLCGNVTYSVCLTDACGCLSCDTTILCGFPAAANSGEHAGDFWSVSYDTDHHEIITTLAASSDPVELELIDLKGRLLHTLFLHPGEHFRLLTDPYAPGIYHLVARRGDRYLGIKKILIH
jgi:hypothetical protein